MSPSKAYDDTPILKHVIEELMRTKHAHASDDEGRTKPTRMPRHRIEQMPDEIIVEIHKFMSPEDLSQSARESPIINDAIDVVNRSFLTELGRLVEREPDAARVPAVIGDAFERGIPLERNPANDTAYKFYPLLQSSIAAVDEVIMPLFRKRIYNMFHDTYRRHKSNAGVDTSKLTLREMVDFAYRTFRTLTPLMDRIYEDLPNSCYQVPLAQVYRKIHPMAAAAVPYRVFAELRDTCAESVERYRDRSGEDFIDGDAVLSHNTA